MSRIGKKPIIFDKDISFSVKNGVVYVAGPKGEMKIKLAPKVTVVVVDNKLEIKSNEANLQGLFRSIINNAIIGVKMGWSKTLELSGVGYRATTSGSELILSVGFSHPVKIAAPTGVSFQVSENKITVLGADKYLIGEIASSIRRIRPAEPYKGKGIRYLGEVIRKKVGKAAKAVGSVGTK